MAPNAHAPVGASNAKQWLECPRSIRFSEKYGEDKPSEAAEEGTLAHALAEDHLKKILAGKKVTTTQSFKKNPLYKPAMEEHVGIYIDTVVETYTEMQQAGDPTIMLEVQLDLTPWIPEGFGTADAVVIGDGRMHVFDLKYGKGVPVHAEENPQLKLYGLGCINEFGCLYDIKEVVLHIIQPRLDSISEWTVSREILEKWGIYVVKPTAKLAYEGKGEFNPGEDQCRWCRGKNRCRAYQNYLLTVCQMRFDDLDGHEREPNELTDEEIGVMLDKVDEIKRWCTSVADYALDQALRGVRIPGYKVVEGTSKRKIINEAKVIDILRENGQTTEQVCKLKGITDLESLVGKNTLKELIGEYIVKPQGNPTLVPESDKRKPLNSMNFEEVKENTSNE